MVDRSIEVLKKVRAALVANSAITALVSDRIGYAVAQNDPYPFIVMRVEMTPNDTQTDTSGEYLVRIQAFDTSDDQMKKILPLKTEIYNTLHRQEQNISLSGLVQCIQKGVNSVMKEPDLKTWMMTVDYRLLVEG